MKQLNFFITNTMLIAIIIIALLVIFVIALYNRLVVLKKRVQEAWSDITVQLKRRYDLIPNLIETVKGYATHEKEVFEKVTEARTRAMNANTTQEKAEAENMLSSTLKSLFAVSENYPDVKASTNFLELQKELRDTEDKILASRRFYNANVRDYNIAITKFPAILIANGLGFPKQDFFELDDAEKEAVKETPKVKF